MKCFHFSNGGSEKQQRVIGEDEETTSASSSRGSRVSWARSLSLMDTRRSEYDSDSRDFSDTLGFHEFLSQRRANHLNIFSFSDLKIATRGFNRALLIGEGGFGSVYRGTLNHHSHRSQIDVAIKQLNRNGHQACLILAKKIESFFLGFRFWILLLIIMGLFLFVSNF
jgi:hypothetical protein